MPKKPECDYENYDGVKYEEDKAMYRKMESSSSTYLHFPVGVCLKFDCVHQESSVCAMCIRHSEYKR